MPARDAETTTAVTGRRQLGGPGRPRRTTWIVVAVVVALNAIGAGLYLFRGATGLGDVSASPTAATRAAQDVRPAFAPGMPQVRSDRWLADLNEAGFAIRARAGECVAASGAAEQSTDGGLTWFPVPVPAVAVVHAIDAGGGAELPTLVGSTADCQPRRWQTADRGVSWRLVDGPTAEWFLRPDAPTAVQTPEGDVPSPCPTDAAVVEIRALAGRAGVVACSSGQVIRSFDNGERWQEFGRLEGIASVSFSGDTALTAAARPGCAGVQILRGESGTWTDIACVAGAEANGAGIAVLAESGLLVTFNGTWRTEDGGRTWSSA